MKLVYFLPVIFVIGVIPLVHADVADIDYELKPQSIFVFGHTEQPLEPIGVRVWNEDSVLVFERGLDVSDNEAEFGYYFTQNDLEGFGKYQIQLEFENTVEAIDFELTGFTAIENNAVELQSTPEPTFDETILLKQRIAELETENQMLRDHIDELNIQILQITKEFSDAIINLNNWFQSQMN